MSTTADPITNPLDRLELFHGEATDIEARVYARLAGVDLRDGDSLSGTIEGPVCKFAHTLPAKITLADAGPGDGLLAQAIVPDPCFWSPKLPFVYSANVELRRGEQCLATTQRTIGIRRLGARGTNLMMNGKRFVLRGVSADSIETQNLEDWHDAETAMYVARPEDRLCRQATLEGVLLVATIDAAPEQIMDELARLARWPAVGLAILGGPTAASSGREGLNHPAVLGRAQNLSAKNFVSAAPNLLLGQAWDDALGTPAPVTLAMWADVVLCAGTPTADLVAAMADCQKPLLAYRPGGRSPTIASARAGCDRLQRDLAPHGDFSGYIV